MNNQSNTTPLSGFRDFGPREQAQRLWLIESSLGVYRRFGYFPIETPMIEREEILKGQYGEEGDSLRYRFKDNGGRAVGLRYDLTVPFARFVAAKLPKSEIRLPYRRSQVGPVFRGESASGAQGRYREFYQSDFDIAGSKSPSADAEVVVVAEAVLQELGIRDFTIRINSRTLLDGILRSCGVKDGPMYCQAALVALDKLEKFGRAAVADELTSKVGVEDPDRLLAIVESPFCADDLAIHLGDDQQGQAGLANLVEIARLAEVGLTEPRRLKIDLSLARGLAYYTGFVIETVVTGAEHYGSVLSGGRYDSTIGVFMRSEIPAVGASLGVDRCLDVLNALSLLPDQAGLADVAVVAKASYAMKAFTLASNLRSSGLSTVLLPDEMKIGRMLEYAEGVARWAIILDERSIEENKLILKRLADRQIHEIDLIPEAITLIKG